MIWGLALYTHPHIIFIFSCLPSIICVTNWILKPFLETNHIKCKQRKQYNCESMREHATYAIQYLFIYPWKWHISHSNMLLTACYAAAAAASLTLNLKLSMPSTASYNIIYLQVSQVIKHSFMININLVELK